MSQGILNNMRSIMRNRLSSRHTDEYIHSIEKVESTTIIRLRGSITFFTLPEIQAEFTYKVRGREPGNVILDLKDVTKVDSSSIALLIERLKYLKTQEEESEIGLINLSEKMRSLLKLLRLQEVFKEYPTEAEALVTIPR